MNLLSSCLSLSTKVQVCIPRPGCLSLFLFVQLKSCGQREVLFSELWCLQSLTPGRGWDLPLLGLSQPTLPCPCFQTYVEGFVADSGLGTDGVLVLWMPPRDYPQSAVPYTSKSTGNRCLALCTACPGKLGVWLAWCPAHFQELLARYLLGGRLGRRRQLGRIAAQAFTPTVLWQCRFIALVEFGL